MTHSKQNLYLVWNVGKTECVGFLDQRDAKYTATGNRRYLSSPFTPSIGDSFRDDYGDDAKSLPMTTVEVSAEARKE